MEHLDRNINGVDVMDHVFRGVRLLSDDTRDAYRDTDVDQRPWFAGTAISAVHITVLYDE